MKQITLGLFLFLFLSSAFARYPTCQESTQIIKSAALFHLNNPKIDKDFLNKAVLSYINMIDPYYSLISKTDLELIKKDNQKNANKYLALFESDVCSIFSYVDKMIISNEKKNVGVIKKALNAGPKEIKVKLLSKPSSRKEIEDYIYKVIRNDLYDKRNDLDTIVSYWKNRPDVFARLSTAKSALIVKAFTKALDPHSNYITQTEWKAFSEGMTGGHIAGFGAAFLEDYIGMKIVRVVEGAPLSKLNLVAVGDHLIQINETPIKTTKDFNEVTNAPAGTEFEMVVKKKETGKNITFKITTANFIDNEEKVSSKIMPLKGKNIAVFTIPGFYFDEKTKIGVSDDLYSQFVSLKSSAKTIDAIVLDLRFNGGGYLFESQKMIGLFVGIKDAVFTEDKSGVVALSSFLNPGQLIPSDIPVIILQNVLTASSSEIVSGALQVYKRALIVGDKSSYGKGSVQQIITNPLSEELGVLKITQQQFFLPDGNSTQVKGVVSDIIIPSNTSKLKGEASVENALKFKKISANQYSIDSLGVDVSRLGSLSKKRVSNKSYKKDLKNEDKDAVLDETLNIAVDYINFKEVR